VDTADSELIDAPSENVRLACKERFPVGPEYPVLLGRERATDVRCPLRDVLSVVVADRPVPILGDPAARRGPLVEAGEPMRHTFEHIAGNFPGPQQAVHHLLLR